MLYQKEIKKIKDENAAIKKIATKNGWNSGYYIRIYLTINQYRDYIMNLGRLEGMEIARKLIGKDLIGELEN